jgi:hypothetical protein
VAGRPLRPATDRRLGKPLPHQLANPTSAAPIVQGLAVPCFHPQVVCGISLDFSRLSPATGHVPMCYSPVRHSTQELPPFRVRLACVRHAASVQSEPGSNSSVQSLQSINSLDVLLHRASTSNVSSSPPQPQRTTMAHPKPSAHTYRFRIVKERFFRLGRFPPSARRTNAASKRLVFARGKGKS